MKKIDAKYYILVLALILYALTYNWIIKYIDRNIYNVFSWGLITLIVYFLIGYTKNRAVTKKVTIQYVIIYFIIYIILIYFLGLITGFYYSPFMLDLLSIIKNTYGLIILIFLKELVRYILIFRYRFNKIGIVIITAVFALVDIMMLSGSYELTTGILIFTFVGEVVIKCIYDNILESVISYNTGWLPSVIYGILLQGYVYVVPIIPRLGIYLTTVLNAVLPIFLLLQINRVHYRYQFVNHKKEGVSKKYINAILICILVGLVSLISGLFRYKIIAVGSDSMNPYMYRGDAVIYETIDDFNNIEVGDILVFAHDKMIVIHRVVQIEEDEYGYLYYTKGDNNYDMDNFVTKESDVIGILRTRIKYIGYPTLWVGGL